MTLKRLQPVERVNEGLANTNSGILFDLLNPTADMFCIDDMVDGLSNVCRWGGQLSHHYSIAQHTLLVWHLAPPHLKKAALLHDAAEAFFLGDVPKPLKVIFGKTYSFLEDLYQRIIFKKYGVSIADLDDLKVYDTQANEIEFNYFRMGNLQFTSVFYEINQLLGYKPWKDLISTQLRAEFLHRELIINR